MWRGVTDSEALERWRVLEREIIVQDHELGCALNLSYVRSRKWVAAPIEGEMVYPQEDPDLIRVVDALRRWSTRRLVLNWLEAGWDCVDGGMAPYLGEVFKVTETGADEEDLSALSVQTWGNRLLIAPDLGRVLLVTREEHTVVAGPEPFVTAAVGRSLDAQRSSWRTFADSWPDRRQSSHYSRIADYYERV
jgi:hypothetical protein